MSNFPDDLFGKPMPPGGKARPTSPLTRRHGLKQAERQAVYDLADTTAEAVSADGSKFQAYLDVQTRFSVILPPMCC